MYKYRGKVPRKIRKAGVSEDKRKEQELLKAVATERKAEMKAKLKARQEKNISSAGTFKEPKGSKKAAEKKAYIEAWGSTKKNSMKSRRNELGPAGSYVLSTRRGKTVQSTTGSPKRIGNEATAIVIPVPKEKETDVRKVAGSVSYRGYGQSTPVKEHEPYSKKDRDYPYRLDAEGNEVVKKRRVYFTGKGGQQMYDLEEYYDEDYSKSDSVHVDRVNDLRLLNRMVVKEERKSLKKLRVQIKREQLELKRELRDPVKFDAKVKKRLEAKANKLKPKAISTPFNLSEEEIKARIEEAKVSKPSKGKRAAAKRSAKAAAAANRKKAKTIKLRAYLKKIAA